jgi:two-component system OmpR family response regulator
MRVLVIEDDKKIASFLGSGLRQEGHTVDLAENGEDGLHHVLTSAHDVIVLDVMLPKLGGLSVLEELRRRNVATPVLVLSAKSSIDDRIRGLQAGADDYLTKPFSFAELVARLQALVRRATGATSAAPTRLSFADLSLDRLARRVRRGDTLIDLQPKEFALLDFFLGNAGRVLTKTQILEQIWECSFDPQTNVVDVLVCRLRQKLDRDFEPRLIHTLRGVGYVLRAD